MANDRYSDMKYEVQLEEEFDKRHIDIPQWVRDIKEPEKRRQAMRKLLRDDDKIHARQKRSNNILWAATIIVVLLVVILVIGVLTNWGYGIPAKAEAQPTGGSVAQTMSTTAPVLQPTYPPLPTPTAYPVQPTPTKYPIQPTYTPLATLALANNAQADPAPVMSGTVSISTSNGWEINRIDVTNDPIVDAWLPKVLAPAPLLWPTYPNVANPLVSDFQVANGVEYGMADSPFCEYKQTCDWVVPAWHYRLVTGDYKFTSPQFSYSCQNVEGQPRKGCMIVLFNVMDETYTWRDQSVDNGFTVMGRYWNGDQLQWAVWGLTSHASANMLNLPTMRDPTTGNVLNAGGLSSNAGANCGVQTDACGTVDVMVIVHAGDRILATLHTIVAHP